MKWEVELTPEGVDAQPHVWIEVASHGTTHNQEDRPFRELALLLVIAANCVPPFGFIYRCIRFTFLQPGVVVDRAMMACLLFIWFCLLFCLFLGLRALLQYCTKYCTGLYGRCLHKWRDYKSHGPQQTLKPPTAVVKGKGEKCSQHDDDDDDGDRYHSERELDDFDARLDAQLAQHTYDTAWMEATARS